MNKFLESIGLAFVITLFMYLLGIAIVAAWNSDNKRQCLEWKRYEQTYSEFELNQEDVNFCFQKFEIKVK